MLKAQKGMVKMKKRILSKALALTMLFSGITAVKAVSPMPYEFDFGADVELGTVSDMNKYGGFYTTMQNPTIMADGDGEQYLSLEGAGLLQKVTGFDMVYSEDTYALNEFNIKVSEGVESIVFRHQFDQQQHTTAYDITVPFDEALRGVDNDTDWINVKLAYNDAKCVTYINDEYVATKKNDMFKNRFNETDDDKSKERYVFTTSNSDGTICLKNIIFSEVSVNEIFAAQISGENTLRIPNENETEAATSTYAVTATDYMNDEVAVDVAWSLASEYNGVSVSEEGILTVNSDAAEGDITLIAAASGKTLSKTVSLVRESVASVAVTGDSYIPLKNRYETGTITATYSAECIDFIGETVESEVTWSVENADDGITIDQDGVVTIADSVAVGTFDVVAEADNKKGSLTVTIGEAELNFQKRTNKINGHFNAVEPGVKTPNAAIAGNVYGLDPSANQGIEGYVSSLEFVEEAEGDVCLKMTYPALSAVGNYKEHGAYLNYSSGAINSDIFVLTLKYKYNLEGADYLRCEIYGGKDEDGKTVMLSYNLKSNSSANLNYKHSVGNWHEINIIFDRKTHTARIIDGNYIGELRDVSDCFWTNGITQLRAVHKGIPTDGNVHELYLDDYYVYIPSGVSLEGIHATAMDGTTERNILNLKTGFANWTVGSSPSLSGEEVSIKLAYLNNSEYAVNVNAIAALYKDGKLVEVSDIGEFEIGAETLSTGNIIKLTLPVLEEGETFEDYTIKTFAWYEDGTPFDYTFTMTNDRWNFAE